MSTKEPSRLFRGTRDFFGDAARSRIWVSEQIRAAFKLFGFEPLMTPVIEDIETLRGKYGEEGNKKIFKLNLKKAGGLRYDHTVPLARFMATNWSKVVLPYKRYALGDVFRNETTQAGRF